MELSTAINLIRDGVPAAKTPQHWADLGAGTGLFTNALATLLPNGSSIAAIDQNKKALNTMHWNHSHVSLNLHTADFSTFIFREKLNGFLIANSLHYIRKQKQQLEKLKNALAPEGRILIVEYETTMANQWVPYPISYGLLETMVLNSGFSKIVKLHTVSSNYQPEGIYAALLLP